MQKQPKIRVSNLILEVTRECNMNCAHCLRGDTAAFGPNTLHMTEAVLTHLYDFLSDIDELTFTGGEPTLNLPIIEQAVVLTKQKGFTPIRGFIATNGKAHVDELLSLCDCLDLFYMRNETQITTKTCTPKEAARLINLLQTEREEGQYLTVALSLDDYHEPIPEENILKLCSKRYFSDAKINLEKFYLINRGRAKTNHLNTERTNRQYLQPYVTTYKDTNDETDIYEIDTLYVTTGGELFTDCDLSYLDMEIIKNSRFDTYLGCIQDYNNPKEFVEDCLEDIADSDTF